MRALIFDLDGTLVDTVYAHVFAWQRAFAEAGIAIDGWRGPTEESDVTNTVDALMLDPLEGIGPKPRAYAEVMEAWRTSCPRLPIWEEANARGFVDRQHEQGKAAMVSVTASGSAFLSRHRPQNLRTGANTAA